MDQLSAAGITAVWVLALVVAWLWRPRQGASLGAWMLLAAYAALGAWALWFGVYGKSGEPPGFEIWKPTVIYWTLAAILIAAPLLGGGYPVKIILGTYFALSTREWRWLNRGFAALYTVLGGVNLWVSAEASYKDWVGFKYGCLMNMLIIVLLRLNFVWLPILADVAIYLYRRVTAAYRAVASLF